jgi:Tol biopolymer transport system component
MYFRTGLPEPAEPMRFQITPPVSLNWGGSFAISPDGRHLAFASADSDGSEHLWLRSLDSLDARELPGTASPHIPPFFWSSDSRFIAYDAGGKLKKVDITGGTPQTLCDLSTNVIGGSWNRDGVILFGNLFGGGGIRMVPAAGGTSSVLVKADPALGVSALYCPTFLSDGRHFLYFQNSSEAEHHGIYLGSIDSKPEGQASRQILPTEGSAVFVPAHDSSPGQILFLREQTLMAQPFDEKRMELAGEPLPVVDQVGSFSIWGFFSASTNGTLIFRGGSATQYSQVTLFDRQGKNLGNLGETDRLYGLAFAPNGARAAVTWNTDQVPSLDLWLIEFTRGIRTRLTFGEGNSNNPVWSQEGRSIAFSSNREGNFSIYRMPVGGGKAETLYKSEYAVYPLSWSSDGRFLLFNEADPKTKADLWVLPLQGDRHPMPFLKTEFNEFDGRFSPNMQWVAYTSDVSGTNEIYLKRFSQDSGSASETGGTTKVSQGGGAGPRWRGDGRELYYRSPDGKVMAVEVGAGTNFEPEPPRILFQEPPAQNEAIQLIPLSIWDVARDGNKFLISTPAVESSPTPFTVVLNWQAGLKK